MGCHTSCCSVPITPLKRGSEVDQKVMAEVSSSIVADPEGLPLTARDIFRLGKSWKGIKRHITEAGVEMLIRLFQENAHLTKLFRGFKELDNADDMRENEMFEHHATLVMTTLDEAFSHLDNLDFVVDLLHKTGSTHRKFGGFLPNLFWNMEQPFLDAIKLTLGDAYTESIEEIYKLAIKFILQSLKDGFTTSEETGQENSTVPPEPTE
ncbi:globin, major polymeric component P1-like isoform X2 [Liolophura sinensis]|uniref:globin, major polymeric component P1-like isoform X2 n=1 Tax=Liolophura sinensis TaxID=3198878 RepID=UPI003158FDBE